MMMNVKRKKTPLSNIVRFESEDRYYSVYLQVTLFGEYTVSKFWGGLNNKRGGYNTKTFDSLEEAKLEIIAVIKKRLKRKYSLVIGSNYKHTS